MLRIFVFSELTTLFFRKFNLVRNQPQMVPYVTLAPSVGDATRVDTEGSHVTTSVLRSIRLDMLVSLTQRILIDGLMVSSIYFRISYKL